MPQPEAYSFPRVTRAEYPLLRGWLAQPHVRDWWGDPDPANDRAIRAYRRAGFMPRGILPCEDGDPVLVMEFAPAPSSW
ncbi:hypothetical protein C0V75_15945 [Tabrizicola sp. TH137]|uniref:hypothetical protein n=1 Tax=Tabrizicola sp. TH137 TaxID=2067452 RepID=UPI000C79D205|nr:hypothetical protein [Tabrizicola sp. TH137]PLL11517.1 hypothetical protein C0V75_15945 [Tabrizicola sp. TH137]